MLDNQRRRKFVTLLQKFDNHDIRLLAHTLENNPFFLYDGEMVGYKQKGAIVARIVRVITHCCDVAPDDHIVFTHARKLLVAALKAFYNYDPVPWDQFALEPNGTAWLEQSVVRTKFASFAWILRYTYLNILQSTVPYLNEHHVAAINSITHLMRGCSTTVTQDTVVYRLTNTDNPPKSGLRSVTVIPSNYIIPGWTGTIYKIILTPGVKVITAPLMHDAYGTHEFEMIVVDGVIDPVATRIAGGNTLVVKDSDSGEEGERHGAKRRRTGETQTPEPLFLRLRIA